MAATGAAQTGEASAVDDKAGCIRVVTQRCAQARLLVDAEEDAWVEVGRGLVFYVSFAQGSAGAEGDGRLRAAAKSLLAAPLSTSAEWRADHTDAESVVSLCRRGEAQAILVVPQASIVSKLEPGDRTIKYHRQCSREHAKGLFTSFVMQLQTLAREQLSKPAEAAGSKQHDQAAWQERQAQRAAAAAVAPESYFKTGDFAGKYSRYDERGVPTHAADGEPLAKSALKKLEKLYSAHVKKFERAGSSGIGTEAAALSTGGIEAYAGLQSLGQDKLEPVSGEADMHTEEAKLELLDGACLPNIMSGTFGGRQGLELISTGPFTHHFAF